MSVGNTILNRTRLVDSTGNEVILEENGSLPVTLQDQTTPVVIVPLHQKQGESTLAINAVIDEYTIELVDATGFVDTNLIIISNLLNRQVYFGTQIGAAVGNVISLDRPLDFSFEAGDLATRNDINLHVNGSVTEQIFSLRSGIHPDLNLTVDITRVMFHMLLDSAANLSLFGDQAPLTYGITCRRRDGNRVNTFNVKTNGDIGKIAYDIDIYSATNPSQGQDGLNARLTFSGQSKMGVVIRIGPDEDYEVIIRDDLSGIVLYEMTIEGSIAIV